jgi:hypothetical protein
MFLTLSIALVPTLAPAVQLTSRPGSDPTGPKLTFVAIGDYGTTEPESFDVAALVRALDPPLVITLGDNNYPSGSASTIDANIGQHYQQFIHPYVGAFGAGSIVNRFFPCLGNHDWSAADAQPYLDYFDLPGNERYYDFRRGPVHFFALDSDESEPDGTRSDSAQALWLRSRLAASDAPFKLVYFHHAPYDSSDVHGSQGDLQWPFKDWGASLVLTGHDHLYERLSVSGLPYVVNGLGGRETYAFGARIGGSELRFNSDPGAVLVTADEEFAHFRFLTRGDTVQDDFVLPRGGIDPGAVTWITADAEWKYRDTGVAPPANWTTAGFDDSTWGTGRAELGYGDGDEATVVSYGGNPTNRHITTWFRRVFAVGRPQDFETLQLRLRHDDGAVVYLNGAEVARSRMPAGPITPSTRATTGVSGNEESTFYPFTFSADGLVDLGLARVASSGWNVLAVEIHQASPSSSDISFAAELVGLPRGRTLLRRGSAWRYLDEGVEPDADWIEPSYDASAWKSGAAQFGYGEGDELTPVDTGHATTWFRTTFSVTDPSAVRWLSLRLLRDDGAIVYLNGAEAARFDLPRTGVLASTYASFNVDQENERFFESTSLDPRLLQSGVNTIAVELHNSGPTSTDLSFDLELVAF